MKGTLITGHFASPNGNRGLDIGMNPAWRDSVIDLIPWEPYGDAASKAVADATTKRMTTVKMQALRDLAPDSGAYFNEVSQYQIAQPSSIAVKPTTELTESVTVSAIHTSRIGVQLSLARTMTVYSQ